MLRENNRREGFVEDDQFEAVKAALPGYVKPLAEVAYLTGWRRGELLSREWRHVDLDNGWLRLEGSDTKAGEGRQFPLIPRLRQALEEQWERKLATERATGRIVTHVFFNYASGEPVKDFRGAWKSACRKAGQPGLLFHDLRRTAVRNLVRAGVAQTVAMQLVGHKTDSVFRRYAIVDEIMLKEGAEKLAEHMSERAQPQRKVVEFG